MIVHTESNAKVTVSQSCAQSIMKLLDSLADAIARESPAHRPPGSFECSRECIRFVHFGRCDVGARCSGFSVAKMYGTCSVALASEARWICSRVLSTCASISARRGQKVKSSSLAPDRCDRASTWRVIGHVASPPRHQPSASIPHHVALVGARVYMSVDGDDGVCAVWVL